MDVSSEILTYEDTDISNPKVMKRPRYKRRRSTIMVEIIDSEITTVDIQKMIEAGMNVAKLKPSHGTRGDRIRILNKVEEAIATCTKKNNVEWSVATCSTLKTCCVKTGFLEGNAHQITLTEGAEIILTNHVSKYDACNAKLIFADNPNLTVDTKVGMEIVLDEGEIILECTEIIDENKLKCVVTKGGELANLVSLCTRGMQRTRPYTTNKDLELISFCMEFQIDVVIIYYCRHVDTLRKAKEIMGKSWRPLIFCAICTQQGLDCIDDLLKESDGLVLAREFLPFELDIPTSYRMAQIQKWIAAKCMKVGKPLFISGDLLEEVLSNGRLTDNQISDVTNAILDGVTGFILTKCNNPERTIDAINALSEICCSVEPLLYNKRDFLRLSDELRIPVNAAEAAVMAAATVAIQTKAQLIVLPTVTGRTAKAILHMRPVCLVVTVSTDIKVMKLLSVYRSTVPLLYKASRAETWNQTVEDRVDFAIDYAVSRFLIQTGDMYITLQRGSDTSCYCDTISTWRVVHLRKNAIECDSEPTSDKLLYDQTTHQYKSLVSTYHLMQ